MDRPIRNVDRPEIKTKEDAIVLWMRETRPPAYAKIVEDGYPDEQGWWEPARYELHKIIDWLLSPVTKKEAEKKAKEKVSKDTDKPKKESVYECAHFEYEYDDLGKYRWCRNRESGRAECNCDYIYAQQFCRFYEKGELRGKWVIGDVEKQAAEEFKKQFDGKVEK